MKRQLTKSEMEDRFNDYFDKAAALTLVSGIFLTPSVPFILLFSLGIKGIIWGITGFILVAVGAGCLIAGQIFGIRSSYWGKKARNFRISYPE